MNGMSIAPRPTHGRNARRASVLPADGGTTSDPGSAADARSIAERRAWTLSLAALGVYAAVALGVGCGSPPGSEPAPTDDSASGEDAGSPGPVAGPSGPDAGSTGERGSEAGPSRADGGANIVVTAQGSLQGAAAAGVVSWKGIPYAAPPTGERRWKATAPPLSWSGTRMAIHYGSECVQSASTGVVGAEDCLFLNVWAPANFAGQSLPVIVFVHGGGWELGSGSLPIYDGSYLAQHGPAVVVTINYRLGAFGFLAHAALATENPQHSTGDYGLLDQIEALRWVQQNIRAFGGDPKRVLMWGESAGGWSTLMLLTSPPARGLFTRAFSDSGGTSARDLAGAESYGASFASDANCSQKTLSCLRALSAATVQTMRPSGWWAPVIDGVVLPGDVMQTFLAGTQAHMPLMIGTNGSEFSYPGIAATPPVTSIQTEADYESALANNFGTANVKAILALYPASSYASPGAAYVATVSDAFMTCSTRRIAIAVSSSQTQSVWRYLYDHTDTNGPSRQYGPGHFMDVPFWFYNFGAGQLTPDAAEMALGRDMTTYLTLFAATGDPNGGGSGAVAWPSYVSPVDPVVQLGTPPIEVDGVRTAKCNLWDQVYPWAW
jgi:para-nitrobenzyl esterase